MAGADNSALASLMAPSPSRYFNFQTVGDAMRARALLPYQQQGLQAQAGEATARTAALSQETALKQAQMDADLKFGQAWADSGGDLAKMHGSLAETAKSDPQFARFVPDYIQKLNTYRQSMYTMGDAEAKNTETKNGLILPLLSQLQGADSEERPAIQGRLVNVMRSNPNLFDEHDIGDAVNMKLDDTTIAQYQAAHQSQQQLLAERKSHAEELQATAAANKDRFQAVGGTLYDLSAKGGPQPVLPPGASTADMNKAVDAIAPPNNALVGDLNGPARVQIQTLTARGDLQGANAVLTKLNEEVSKRNEQVNPAVIQGKAQQSAQTEIERNTALAPDLNSITQTTIAGRKYISAEDVKGASESLLRKQAANAGVPVVDKDVASMLSDIDTARKNQQSMLDTIQGKLATSAGERIYKGPENKLAAAMQTDPTLAAMGTFRNAAIQSMRAVAGSKGLRINQAEVQLAIDNDIPKMTDTWDVAQAKIKMLQQFLDNTENAHLTRNRGGGNQPNGAPNLPQVAKGFTRVQASDGSVHDIPSGKMDQARKRDPGLKALVQ